MSNDRLLSDEELLAEVLRIAPPPSTARLAKEQLVEALELLDLINTQKKLYAESVIGEDEYVDPKKEANVYADEVARNELRAEQRARIK